MENIFERTNRRGLTRKKSKTPITKNSSRRESLKNRFKRLKRGERALVVIGTLPEKGEEIALIVDGNFLGMDILNAVIELAGEPCKALHIATLSLNPENARQIAKLIDSGKILSATMVISEKFAKQSAETFNQIRAELDAVDVPVAVDRNHAKINLFDYGKKKYVMHGSLNLRRCMSFEQCVLAESEELYSFFLSFMDDIRDGSIQALPQKTV